MKKLIFLVSLVACLSWWVIPNAQVAKPVYVSPVDGTGTDDDPFRSRCLGLPGAGNIDLSPWGIQRYICTSDVLPSDTRGIIQLGDSLRASLTTQQKSALDTLLGRTLTATTIDQAIVEIVRDKIRAGKDGKLKIYLGDRVPMYQRTAWVPFEDHGLVADVTNYALHVIAPTLAWATAIAEDWNCSNSTTLTCDLTWTEFFGTEWAIVSNQVAVSGLTGVIQKEARADSALAGDDHWAQATIVSATADSGGTVRCGPIARKANDATRTFYMFVPNMVNNAFTQYETARRSAGSLTSIATNATDPVAGEVVQIYVDGSDISGYVDGVLRVGPTTDANISGNTYTGIAYSSNNPTTQSCVLDDFSAEDISIAVPFGFHRNRRG